MAGRLLRLRAFSGISCLLLAGLAGGATPENAYVSDQLVITVRDAPSRAADILMNLRTGDSVLVLERPPDSDFVRVRTQSGVEGWSLAQYLMAAPAAAVLLEQIEAESRGQVSRLDAATAKVDALEAELARTGNELEQITRQFEAQALELTDIRNAAAGSLALREQNAVLSQRLESIESATTELAAENAALAARTQRDWFIAGAGVLGGGMIIGWILSRISRRKRWEW